MSFSVVDFGAIGIGGHISQTHDFTYTGFTPGDIVVFCATGVQVATASFTFEGDAPFAFLPGGPTTYITNSVPASTYYSKAIAFQPNFYFDFHAQYPSTGTIHASMPSDGEGVLAYWIIHDSEGMAGVTSDYLGFDMPDMYGNSYQNLAGPLSGSMSLTVGSRAAAFDGEQIQMAAACAWSYRPAGGSVNQATLSAPSGMTTVQAAQSSPEHIVGMGGYEIGAAGTVPGRSSTLAWSQPTDGATFPNNVGEVGTLTTPTLYIAQRHHVTVHKTIIPNMDSYAGPADVSDFVVEIVDNTPSGFPYLGPRALVTFAGDGDDARLPDNDLYTNWDGTDNAGADWPGAELVGVPDYDVSDISGDGGNVIVTWTSGNSFTVQVNGDGDLYLENTYTGSTPTPSGDYWGILSGDP